MNDLVIQGIVTAVVVGAVEGWRRASLTRAVATASTDAEARTRGLGSNLGPRVESLSDRVSRIEGKLGMLASEKGGHE